MYILSSTSLLRYKLKIDSVWLFNRQVQFQYSHSHRIIKSSGRYTSYSKSAVPAAKRIIARASS